MKTRLILVRHAVTDANVSNLFLGLTDVKLSDKGLLQAKSLSHRLSHEMKIDVIYSSNMKRTLQTAYYVASEHGIPVLISKKLREINFGQWEGRTHEEIASEYPYEFLKRQKEQKLLRTVHGEGLNSFQKRLVAEVKKIVKSNPGKTICIVSHGACIKALTCYFKGYSLNEIAQVPWSENTAISVIEFDDSNCDVVTMSDASHLTTELRPATYNDIGKLMQFAEQKVQKKAYKMQSVKQLIFRNTK